MPPRRGSWTRLAPGTKRRWVARFGGRGTPEVRARRARAAYELGGTIHRAEAGHEPAATREAVSMSAMFEGLGFSTIEAPTPSERRRIARWNSRAGELRQGQISPHRFSRLVGSWAPLRGEMFEADPAVVLATLAERAEGGEDLFRYEGRRT